MLAILIVTSQRWNAEFHIIPKILQRKHNRKLFFVKKKVTQVKKCFYNAIQIQPTSTSFQTSVFPPKSFAELYRALFSNLNHLYTEKKKKKIKKIYLAETAKLHTDLSGKTY